MSIDRVRDNFEAVLESIQGQSKFLAAALKIRLRSAYVFSRDRLDPADLPTINEFQRSRIGNGEPAFEALYVSICFHYEEFIREVHRAVLEEINRRYKPVDLIKKQLLLNHVAATGRVMARSNDDRRASKADMTLLAKNILSCVAGTKEYRLNAEVFTMFFAGATISAVQKLFEQIGCKFDLEEFGRNEKLKAHFKGGGVREVKNLTLAFVDDFVEERNRIVHRGGGYRPITDSVIDGAVGFFIAFSQTLSSSAKVFCDRYPQLAEDK